MQGAFVTQKCPQKNTSGRKEGVGEVPCTADPQPQSLPSATEHRHAEGAILQYGMTYYCPYFQTLTGTKMLQSSAQTGVRNLFYESSTLVSQKDSCSF